jgi:hypothetical protein
VQRDLSRLGCSTEQNQEESGRDQPVGIERPLGQDFAQSQAAGALHQDEEAGQEGEPTASGDDQGLRRTRPCSLPFVFQTDQEERSDAGEFPEDEQENHVIGEHQAEHRCLEGEECDPKVPAAWMMCEVRDRIERDECTDASDEEREQESQPVQAEREIRPERGEPRNRFDACRIRVSPPGAGSRTSRRARTR